MAPRRKKHYSGSKRGKRGDDMRQSTPQKGIISAFCTLIVPVISTLILLSPGCGSVQKPAPTTPDIAFVIQNTPHRLSQYRGEPVLLILMRTSEMVSQIYMERLRDAFADIRGRCRLIVLSVEPTEAPFIETYRDIESLPFAIGSAEKTVRLGTSALGIVPAIPYTYFIGADGRVLRRVPGVIETAELVDAVGRFFDR